VLELLGAADGVKGHHKTSIFHRYDMPLCPRDQHSRRDF
jgi:hypothetical protein